MAYICDSEMYNLAKGTKTGEYDKYHLKQESGEHQWNLAQP